MKFPNNIENILSVKYTITQYLKNYKLILASTIVFIIIGILCFFWFRTHKTVYLRIEMNKSHKKVLLENLSQGFLKQIPSFFIKGNDTMEDEIILALKSYGFMSEVYLAFQDKIDIYVSGDDQTEKIINYIDNIFECKKSLFYQDLLTFSITLPDPYLAKEMLLVTFTKLKEYINSRQHELQKKQLLDLENKLLKEPDALIRNYLIKNIKFLQKEIANNSSNFISILELPHIPYEETLPLYILTTVLFGIIGLFLGIFIITIKMFYNIYKKDF